MSITGTVGDYMSPNPLCLPVSESLEQARETFVSNRFTVAPVVDGEGVALGVVSATDLLADTDGTTVEDVLSGKLYTTGIGDSIVEAAVMMTDCGVHHLVVLDGSRRPIGILSNIDVARAVSEADIDQPISYVMSDELITVDLGMSIEEAGDMLADAGVSSAPVVDGGRAVGMVSKMALLSAYDGAERVDEVMDENVHTAEPSASIATVAQLFAERGARRVFVVDENYDLIGVVSATDIAGFVGSWVEQGEGIG